MDGADAMIFQSTLPARGATYKSPLARCQEVFQSTLPARGATGQNTISGILTELFQSTLPARGATRTIGEEEPHVPISIHAPRTGSDMPPTKMVRYCCISIHAPRTGSDSGGRSDDAVVGISIHAPRTGSDGFQRPPFVRRSSISIHAPRTGSDDKPNSRATCFRISIHAPRTGSDHGESSFLFTSAISIHAPRTGSDAWHLRGKQMKANFNPRSPHGERLRVFGFRAARDDFNPRSPHGERLHPAKPWKTDNQFQSTLPARGATRCSGCRRRWRIFQSTLPARGATQRRLACGLTLEISIHAPRTGSDRNSRKT